MIKYRVEVTPRAAREIRKSAKSVQTEIVVALEALETIPRPFGVEKLTDCPGLWRMKLGRERRVVYAIDDSKHLIVVAIIANRRDAYRDVRKLDAASLLAAVQPVLNQRPPAGPPQ